MKAAIYLRVSRQKDGSGYSVQTVENQFPPLSELVKGRNWEVYKQYVDYDSASDLTKERNKDQEFFKMLEDARQHKFDVLVFWSLDRLSREGAVKTLGYLKQFKEWGIGFVSYSEQYLDSTGIWKDAIVAIMATIAQQESVRMSERTKAGMARAKLTGTKSGKEIGRPKVFIDLDNLVELREKKGLSWGQLSRKLACGRATVIRAYKQARPEWEPVQKGMFRRKVVSLKTKDLVSPIALRA